MILRDAPNIVREGAKSNSRAYLCLVLLSQIQKTSQGSQIFDAPPLFPAPLPSEIVSPTWDLIALDTQSISVVLNRVLKTDPTGIVDKHERSAAEKTMKDLLGQHEVLSGVAAGELPEVDWGRMRDITFQSLLSERIGLLERLVKMTCRSCPDFDEHVRWVKFAVERSLTRDSIPRCTRSNRWRLACRGSKCAFPIRTSSFCPTTRGECRS